MALLRRNLGANGLKNVKMLIFDNSEYHVCLQA